MKTQLCPIALLIVTATLPSSPTLAQSQQVAFYCGRTTQNEFATLVQVKGKEGTTTIVVWKDKSENRSPQQRCDASSRRFQAAWDRGGFNHLVSKLNNKIGRASICAVSSPEKACEENNILFTLKNAKEGENMLNGLRKVMKGTVSQPIYQSNSEISIDMQELIKSISDSAEK
jgi:Circadian oscillating protein COP23